jgi:hypothetical protein
MSILRYNFRILNTHVFVFASKLCNGLDAASAYPTYRKPFELTVNKLRNILPQILKIRIFLHLNLFTLQRSNEALAIGIGLSIQMRRIATLRVNVSE